MSAKLIAVQMTGAVCGVAGTGLLVNLIRKMTIKGPKRIQTHKFSDLKLTKIKNVFITWQKKRNIQQTQGWLPYLQPIQI